MKILFLGNTKALKGVKKTAFKRCAEKTANWHNHKIKFVHYVFLSDEELLEINMRFLNHNTYTDIITFDLSTKKNVIEAEVYISTERVFENAITYNTPHQQEILRVMFHGLLHLVGFKDKLKSEQLTMRQAEDECLNLYRETTQSVSRETKP